MAWRGTGDVVELPVGGMIRKRGDQAARSADMARLQALSDLLGMNQMEVVGVQSEMAEQAYKGQAQEVMRSGECHGGWRGVGSRGRALT